MIGRGLMAMVSVPAVQASVEGAHSVKNYNQPRREQRQTVGAITRDTN